MSHRIDHYLCTTATNNGPSEEGGQMRSDTFKVWLNRPSPVEVAQAYAKERGFTETETVSLTPVWSDAGPAYEDWESYEVTVFTTREYCASKR